MQKGSGDRTQNDYYLKLGGSAGVSYGFISVDVNGDGKMDKHVSTQGSTNIKISAKVRDVQINRPWLNRAVMDLDNFSVPGYDTPGSWSTGEVSSSNKGAMPMISTKLIVAKEIKVTADKFSKEISDTLKSFDAGVKVGLLVSSRIN